MASKFSDFARKTKKLEEKLKSANVSKKNDSVPAKDKNPDDIQIE